MAGHVPDISNDRLALDAAQAKPAITVALIVAVVGLLLTVVTYMVGDHGDHGGKDHGGDAHGTAEPGHGATAKGDGHGAGGEAHEDDHGDDHAAGGHGGHAHFHGYVDHEHAFWHPYLLNFAYFASLALGALFFVILHHLVRAGWSVTVRRLCENLSMNIVFVAILAIPFFFSEVRGALWVWEDSFVREHDELVHAKAGYLDPGFFMIRIVVFFGVWALIAWFFRQRSVEQDRDGDLKHSHLLARIAPVAMLFFALSITFFAFDFLMSLDAHWFSTIFGVNYFAGGFMGAMALLALTAVTLQKRGFLQNAITKHHYHDLGKLTFAFMVFWTYTAFSQYMLIWYANIPEETGWYLIRQQNSSWITFSLLYFAGHFFVPFFFLLSRHVKRSPKALSIGCGWVLMIHWIDMYYLVMPPVRPFSPMPKMTDVGIFLAMGGLFVAGIVFWSSRASLLARRDPRLVESLAFENV